MDLIVSLALVGLLLGAVAGLFYWSAVLFHISRTMLVIPTAERGVTLDAGDEPVCVIIPAHNEERSIAGLASSLIEQDYPALRIVFCLDRCTDGTRAEIERVVGDDPRVEILEIDHCPDGWAGKVHALSSAVQQSRSAGDASILLFADADTTFDPRCVRATVALLRHRGLSMLSLLSTLHTDRWFERVVQPAAGFELLRQYPIWRANAKSHGRAFANGQFIMIRREAYHLLGGHESVREALLEDLALARRAAKADLRVGVFLASGMLRCRMYPDWPAFERGWKRIYTEAANRRPARLRTSARRVRLSAIGAPLFALAAVAIGGWFWWSDGDTLAVMACLAGAGALLTCKIGVMLAYLISGTPIWSAAAYPVGAWMVGSILRQAASDLDKGVPTQWGGRTYTREAR